MVSEKGSSNSGGQGHTQIATVNVMIYMTLYGDDLVFLLPVYKRFIYGLTIILRSDVKLAKSTCN